ncbi:hypothetical protein QR98_0021130 [Sarcoptes scabiei]|uniref:Uncharacterized protein n=1 Tax=Sarcoptes scabiei TaxID=52283 RepID=A0A131ZYT5_SARSC|nr:hypothetical protein QR98_0021130 [Sarcoptes scabiei]
MSRKLLRIHFLVIIFATICYQNNIKPIESGIIRDSSHQIRSGSSSPSFSSSSSSSSASSSLSSPSFSSLFSSQQINDFERINFDSYLNKTIGCLFADICPEDQVCFDDRALGRCEDYDPLTDRFSSDYIYQLDRKTFLLLEQELTRLALLGFDWPDSYTQCILKTILNDRPRTYFDRSFD